MVYRWSTSKVVGRYCTEAADNTGDIANTGGAVGVAAGSTPSVEAFGKPQVEAADRLLLEVEPVGHTFELEL